MSGHELADGIQGAAIVICNDYEFELIGQKTGFDEDAVLEHRRARRHARRERLLDLASGRGGRAGGRPTARSSIHRRRRRVPRPAS